MPITLMCGRCSSSSATTWAWIPIRLRPTTARATPRRSGPSAPAASRPAGAPRKDSTVSTTTNPAVAELLGRSNRLGSDPANTNYAGGNTSAKGEVVDPVTQRSTELLWVKGSGGDLGALVESGLAVLR